MSLLGIKATIRYYKLRGNSVVHATPLTCLEHLPSIVRDESLFCGIVLYAFNHGPLVPLITNLFSFLMQSIGNSSS